MTSDMYFLLACDPERELGQENDVIPLTFGTFAEIKSFAQSIGADTSDISFVGLPIADSPTDAWAAFVPDGDRLDWRFTEQDETVARTEVKNDEKLIAVRVVQVERHDSEE